ncbi:MAG: hypothetical protein GF381_03940 [Candidatus Pacebacteria bacterium]|nr:hypothetical protein [Candidatus Paceibacterota bacterium]
MLLLIYFLLLIAYTFFSYGLTAPNLTLLNQPWFGRFQDQMWTWFYDNRSLTSKAYLGLVIALFLTYLFLIKRIWRQTQKSSSTKSDLNKQAIIKFLSLSLPLVLAFNALSYDVFNYIFNAKMVLVYRANPHFLSAINYSSDPWVRFMHNIHTPAPYWYGWTVFSLLPYSLGLGKFLPTWLSFKLLSLVSLLVTGWALQFFTRRLRGKKLKLSQLALFFLNPLVLIEILANAHNDLWMIAPAIVSLGLLLPQDSKINHQKRNSEPNVRYWQVLASGLLLVISISTKMATLALIPLWFGLVVSQLKNWKKDWSTSLKKRLPLIASGLMFLPLLSLRSQQFHPWYLSWSLAWLPLFDFEQTSSLDRPNLLSKLEKIWRNSLIIFSLTSLLRYLPYLEENGYSPLILAKQKALTWIGPIIYLASSLVTLLYQQLNLNFRNEKK